MKPSVVLAISVVANLALGIAAAKLLRAPTPVAVTAPANASAASRTESLRIVTNLPPATTFVTNRFDWQQLGATNLDTFAANLRAIGCPERTIRDIVVGEVWRLFAAFENQPDSSPFWANGPRLIAERRRRESETLQLKNELTATLRRLFGYEWSPRSERNLFEEENAICRVLLGEISEDQLEQATAMMLSAEDLKEEVAWQCGDVFLDEDYAALRRRRDELEQRVRAVLSPAQFEEFSARVGMAEWLFASGGLERLKPTAAELRQIALAKSQVRPLGWDMLDLDDSLTEEEKEADEAAVEQRVRQILGEARFAEFELLKDHNYRTIHSFAEQNSLPVDTAHKLYEVRKLAAAEVRTVREDKSLDSQSRTQRLQAVAQSLTPAVNTLLGPKLFADYLRHGGQWVTNVNQL
jgi:hypothetical protein